MMFRGDGTSWGWSMAIAVAILSLTYPAWARGAQVESYDGRGLVVYVPSKLPPAGTRALVIVLHGGFGNAERIESGRSEHGLNMDAVADRAGFVVAYLNGTAVTRFLGADKRGWNAGGGCCGLPARNDVDDVGYITGAARQLEAAYGIDRHRVFGIGHSNGAMMTQRVICETDLYAAAVAISGPLNVQNPICPGARGRRILAIHGAEDGNVPIAGGEGTRGASRVAYRSEAESRRIFTAAGALYDLNIVAGAGHGLDEIDTAIEQRDGVHIAEKTAAFFGLLAEKN